MPANTALVTDAAKLAAQLSLADYSAGVFAHITGDWGQHNDDVVYAQDFLDQSGNISCTSTLRTSLTYITSDLVLAMPINLVGTSAIAGDPPIITVQPVDRYVQPNSTVQFTVAAISDLPITYQWNYNGLAIFNQVNSVLILTGVQVADDGYYSATVANANGAVLSQSGTLTVSGNAPPGGGGDNTSLLETVTSILDPFNPLDGILNPFSLF